jgi:hypothetical protein
MATFFISILMLDCPGRHARPVDRAPRRILDSQNSSFGGSGGSRRVGGRQKRGILPERDSRTAQKHASGRFRWRRTTLAGIEVRALLRQSL